MNVEQIKLNLEIPENVQVSCNNNQVTVKGEQGEVKRTYRSIKVKISTAVNQLSLQANKCTKREKMIIGTFAAHLKNAFRGVRDKHTYQVKICSGHFPMNVSVNNNQVIVKNFLGEKIPRIVGINTGVEVKIEGDIINIEGVDKEATSSTAASIEQLTRITNRDRRIFQDGLYIINKDGKAIK